MTIYELSTYPFIHFAKNSPNDMDEYNAAIVFTAFEITNYGQLEEHINKGTMEFQNPYFKILLQKAYISLNRYNGRKITAPLYTFDTYENSGIDKNLLEKTDIITSCTVLPFNSPLTIKQALGEHLKDITIKEAKDMLSSYGSNDKNALEMRVLSFGHSKSEEVARLLKFYDEQIVRTAENTENLQNFSGSLFTKDFKEKRRLVSINATEMCNHLVDEGDTFIWGDMDEDKKELLRSRVTLPNDKIGLNTYFKFLDTIASYTTMEDLETPLSRKRAVERFIIK